MPDLASILERESRTAEAPEASIDRLLRRRARRQRNQRIASAIVGAAVALIGIGWSFLAIGFGTTTQPASGPSAAPEGSGDGWAGYALPTLGIWVALAVLGLGTFAFVRLRRRTTQALASATTSGSGRAPEPGPDAESRTSQGEGVVGMDSRTKQDRGLTQTRPRGVVEQPQARGRGAARGIWIAVIAALLAGLTVGYFLRWSVEPETASKTIAPAAYTTSRDVQARVTFDGRTCAYSGPAEVAAGARIAFDYTAVGSVESAMALIRLLPGMTYERMLQVATRDADNPPSWAVPNWVSEPAGAPHQSLAMSLDDGVWAILCLTSPETTNDVVMGTMIRAVGG